MKVKVKNLRAIMLFYIPFLLYSFCYSLIKMTTFGMVFDISILTSMLMSLSIALIVIKIVTDKITVNKLLICSVLLTIGLLCNYYSRRNDFLVVILFLLAGCEGVEIKKFIKCSMIMQIVILSGTILACLLGILPDWTYSSDLRLRHSYGFVYPSILSSLFFYISLSYFFLRKTIRVRDILLFEGLNLYLFYLTGSRTAFALLLVVFPLFVVIKNPDESTKKHSNNFSPILKVFLLALPAMCFMSSLFLSYEYLENKGYTFVLNILLSNRLMLAAKAIYEQGIHLFGTVVSWVGNGGRGYTFESYAGYNFVDNSYMYILITYGIVAVVGVVILYTLALKWIFEAQNNKLCFIIVLVVLYGLIEPRLIEIYFNPFVLVVALQIYEKREYIKKSLTEKINRKRMFN